MRQSDESLQTGIRRTLLYQGLLVAAASVGFAFLQGERSAWSACFGGVGSIIMTLLLALKVYRLGRRLEQDKPVAAMVVMLGFAPRLLLVAAIFGIGLRGLDADPVPMLLGFALTHAGYLLNFYRLKQ